MDLILIRGESMMGEMIDEEWPFFVNGRSLEIGKSIDK